jgi:NADH-quinone oxidoreductase subunit I
MDKINQRLKLKVPLNLLERLYVFPIFTGMLITLKHFFHKPVTVSYPEQMPYIGPRFRGRHVLKRNEKGQERCTACQLCELVCPSHCITIKPEEVTESKKHLYPEERYAKKFDIDLLRCIFCGLCEEACPKASIFLEGDFQMAGKTREELILHKEDMMEKAGTPVKYVN